MHAVEAQKLETQKPFEEGIPALFGLNPVSNFSGFAVHDERNEQNHSPHHGTRRSLSPYAHKGLVH